MVKKSYTNNLQRHLESITVKTWFDIGYFLDKLKSAKPIRPAVSANSLRAHKAVRRNVAFITYSLGKDDVSEEMIKTARAWRRVVGKSTNIHWLAGRFEGSIKSSLGKYDTVNEEPLLQGFEAWGEPYRLLFYTKLSAGDRNYNELPLKIWADAKMICYLLLEYIEEHNIELILAANVASNPGNISLTLALTIISELYNVNVISDNHDFYWEGISSRRSRKKNAPRDHFYKNADLGVMFSVIQMLYPWNSAKWIHINRHKQQSQVLIDNLGFNPFNVTELTSVVPKTTSRKIPKKKPSTDQELKQQLSDILTKIMTIREGDVKERKLAAKALSYIIEAPRDEDSKFIYQANRTYIPGLLRLRFLSQVKSYIDPGHFRIEEKQTMSRVFAYARQLIPEEAAQEQKDLFYRSISSLLNATKGRHEIEFDTTFDYRYRNSTKFLWRELTEPGLLGAVTHLADTVFDRTQEILPPYGLINLMSYALNDERLVSILKSDLVACMSLDINLAPLSTFKPAILKQFREEVQATIQKPLVVYDSKFFHQRVVDRPQALIILPGSKNTIFWQLFGYEQILANWFTKNESYQLTFVCRDQVYGNDITISELSDIIKSNIFPNLKKALDTHCIQIIALGSRSSSIDLLQISDELKRELLRLKKNGGHVLAKGEQNYFSLDLLDLDSFRYGTLHAMQSKAVFDIVDDQGFFQFVPAGLRTFFAFPLTVETPSQFSKALNSVTLTPAFLTDLKIYLDMHGTSLRDAIQALSYPDKLKDPCVKRLSGKYTDGYAWTGVAVTLKPNKSKYSYQIVSSRKNKTLPQFVKAFELRTHSEVIMGWNGGYILNLELVGKLKISQDLIGTPLGLIISQGKVLCLPLFNRPAFAVKSNGEAFIEEVKLDFPGRIYQNSKLLWEWKAQDINSERLPDENVAVYSPYSGLEQIPVQGRIIVVLGGRKIISIAYPEDHLADSLPLFPAGITFSLPASMRDTVANLKLFGEIRLDVDLPSPWNEVTEAMEAGPLLIKDGKYNLNLKNGGWLLKHSLDTQVTRRDRENERWPLIGCGITKSGNIVAVVVESRIRESVGATHAELAEILLKEGVVVAMEYDSGGSASLYTDKGLVNIVPYTSTFNERPLTGRSEARPVANAVLVHTQRKKKA